MEGTMKEKYLVIAIVIAVLAIIALIKLVKGVIKIVALIAVIAILCGSGGYINANFLSSAAQNKLNDVVQKAGGDYVKVDGGSILVKVKDDWVNIRDIKVIGEFAKDKTIQYDGKTILLDNAGLSQTIQVLQDVGLLKKNQ